MNNPAIGSSWEEVRAELFTGEEIAASDERADRIRELIRAARENNWSWEKLQKRIDALYENDD